MSPKAFIENSQHEYDENCDCAQCILQWRKGKRHEAAMRHGGYPPGREVEPWWRISLNTIICSTVIAACLVAVVLLWPSLARARTGVIHPVPAPSALLKARDACPLGKPLKCRAALVKAYQSVAWQRHQRWHAQASTSKDVVLDAIHWAADKTGVPAWRMIGIGTCESHLFWLAENGQYKSWAQLSTRHRSDPLIANLTWRDPYAVALHVARYIKQHGEGEWQCRSSGGLRW